MSLKTNKYKGIMMNKKIFLIIGLCLVTLFLIAEADMRYGVKAGLNIANVSGDNDDDNEVQFDFALGGFLEFQVNPNVSIQPELLYTRKGSYYEESLTYVEDGYSIREEIESTLNLDYIQIPVLVKYKPANNFNLFAGPALGLLMTAEGEDDLKATIDGVTISDSDTYDIKDQCNTTEIALVFGGEYNYQQFVIDVRYDLGLTNIYDSDDFEIFNRVFTLSLGYKF